MSAEKNVRGARPGNQNAKKEGATASAHINIRTRPEAKKNTGYRRSGKE